MPYLYQSVTPTYLERLVGRNFAACGDYAKVIHVGTPDDDGDDLVLVDGELPKRPWQDIVAAIDDERRASIEPETWD